MVDPISGFLRPSISKIHPTGESKSASAIICAICGKKGSVSNDSELNRRFRGERRSGDRRADIRRRLRARRATIGGFSPSQPSTPSRDTTSEIFLAKSSKETKDRTGTILLRVQSQQACIQRPSIVLVLVLFIFLVLPSPPPVDRASTKSCSRSETAENEKDNENENGSIEPPRSRPRALIAPSSASPPALQSSDLLALFAKHWSRDAPVAPF